MLRHSSLYRVAVASFFLSVVLSAQPIEAQTPTVFIRVLDPATSQLTEAQLDANSPAPEENCRSFSSTAITLMRMTIRRTTGTIGRTSLAACHLS